MNTPIDSLSKLIEENRRTLEKIKSFGRPAEELRRQLEQIRLSAEMPEALRRSIADVNFGVRISDELKRAAERIRLAESGPLRRSLEQTWAVFQFPEELKRSIEEIRSFSRIPEELARGLEEMSKSAQIPAGVMRGLEEMRAAVEIPDDLKRALENMSAVTPVTEHLHRMAETVAANIARQTDLRDFWNAVGASPLTTLSQSIAALKDEEVREIHVQNDGSIVLDGEKVTSTEIHSALTQFITDRQQDLSAWLSTLRRPLRKAIRFLLQTFLATVLQVVLTPYLDHGTPRQLNQLREEFLRDGAQSRSELREALKDFNRQHQEDFSEWRITIASVLNVKSSRAPKARIIDRIPIGSIVHFITKHGPWTLIEYRSDADGEMKKGWVYNKYLSRVEKFF
jgi:hypothetical protein